MLFARADSREAARALVTWLKTKERSCTKSELSGFSRDLASGKLGTKLSRTNFYKGIVARFLDLGLMAEDRDYDPEAKRVFGQDETTSEESV